MRPIAKSTGLSVSLLAMTSVLPLFTLSAAPVAAQCVMTDVSVQLAVRGSRNPAQQVNNVNMQDQGGCVGNAVTQTNSQVYVGGADQVRQIRNSNQRVGGPGNGTGVSLPAVKVPVGVQVDVYSPAHDPNFMRGLPR